MKKKFLWIMLLMGVFLGMTVNCYAFSYHENVNPDLAGQNVGSLDIGASYVNGSMFGDDTDGTFDKDPFSFAINTGVMLTGIKWDFKTSYFDADADGQHFAGIDWNLYDVSHNLIDSLIGSTSGNGNIYGAASNVVLFSNLNLGAGTYILEPGLWIEAGDSWSTSYWMTLQGKAAPDPVPEPATFLLFSTGFVGFAVAGRRKFLKK